MTLTSVRAFRKGLRILERSIELALISQSECCGVTPAQCHLLLEVGESGEASIGELAAALELDASTLSRTVDGLVKSGLLIRREDPSNRRRQLICLSDEGQEKADNINATCDHYYGALLGTLPEREADNLIQSLPLLVRAMRSSRTGVTLATCGETGAATRDGCCPDSEPTSRVVAKQTEKSMMQGFQEQEALS